MAKGIRLSGRLEATPKEVYRAWLSSGGHSAMTGGKAKMSAKKGASYTAWGSYIKGKNLKLKSPSRIVQSWRGSTFPKGAPDSQLDVRIAPAGKGSRITLIHTKLPHGEAGHLRTGWRSHYLVPMRKYFAKQARKKAR
jgi:activator of HSP90 ATPase